MILCNLKLENFKRYKSYEIKFQEGLVGIIGKNGSGKSTIFEAILFALYGELKTKGYKEIIRNADASTKDAVVVELEFEFDTTSYTITREFRGKALSANAKLYKNGEPLSSGAKEVTQSIIKLTKMNKEAFLHTLFASQKELTSLSNSKPEDRKKMIRKLLGLEKIDFIEKELVEKSRELKRDITAFGEFLLSSEDIKLKKEQIKINQEDKKSLQIDITKQSKELDTLKLKENSLKKELELFVKQKDEKQKASNTLELLNNTINSSIENSSKLTKELKDLEDKQKEYTTLLPTKKEYEELQLHLKEQIKLKEFHLKKEGLQKECSEYEPLKQKESKIQTELTNLQTTLKQLTQKEKLFSTTLSAEQRVINDTTTKIQNIQNLGKNSNCPTCTRPLLEEYDNVIESLNSTIQDIQQNKINSLQKELSQLEHNKKSTESQIHTTQKELQELSNKLALIVSKQKDLNSHQVYFKTIEQKGKANNDEIAKLEIYNYDPNLHSTLEKDLNSLEPKYKTLNILETTLKRYDSVKKELEELTKKIKELKSNYDTKEIDYKQINYIKTAHETKQKEYEQLQKQKELQSSTLNTLKVNIATIDGKINTIQSSLDQNDKQLKKVKTKKDDLLDYDKIKLSLSEFKTKLNSKIAPRISEIASTMYAQITKGKYQHIEVSNDFDFFIYDEGKKYPIERFSGGEIDLANLVLRIAISKTLTELSGGSQVEFLAFDEVFGSQDESRRMEILEVFHTIKEQYRQIFLISHEMEIKEMFERVVEL